MRLAHYIRGNRNTETPSEAIFFDTETKPERIDERSVRHRLWFGWAAYVRRRSGDQWTKPDWFRFTSAAELWRYFDGMVRPKTRLYGFCHNTSFDLPVTEVFTHLPDLGWKLSRACIDAPPTIISFTQPRRSICLLDTLNLWRMPLRDLGRMVGADKLDMPSPDAPAEHWDRYAQQDVNVIMQACLRWWQFLRHNDLGGFAPTLAGQAFRTYRHRFMTAKILADDNPDALRVSRAAYLGGRCECYHIGEVGGPLYALDVNSMYPSVMRGNLYPARLLDSTTQYGQRAIDKFAHTHCLTADVEIDTDEPAYPKVIDGKLCFPVGRFRCALAGPELLHALKHDRVTKVGTVAVYHPAEMFTAFIDDMYARRISEQVKGNVTASWLYKILMNSLYGKFGQRGIIWEEEGRCADMTARAWVEIDYHTGEVRRLRQLAGLVQAQSGEAEGRDSCPAIAAYVTSYARMLLWRLICTAGRENVFYTDTDSLLVNAAGLERLQPHIDGSRLGALKIEGTYPGATIWGPKDYVFGDKERHKGVRTQATWLAPDRVTQEKWSSLKGALRAGDMSLATTTFVDKHLSRRYSKGVVGPDGGVSPLVLPGEVLGLSGNG